MPTICESCGLKHAHYGLPAEGRRRWCAGCAAAGGSGAVSMQIRPMCEGCGTKRQIWHQPREWKKRWCG